MGRKINNISNPLKQSLWQIPTLVLLACLIGIMVNHWRTDGIPLMGDWSIDVRFSDSAGESLVIPLSQTSTLFKQKSALFIDARPKEQYDEGHIQGALSLPWHEVDQSFVEIAGQLEDQKNIITYCDGEFCELSHELALFLKEMGFQNVHVLVNGWTLWQEAGLPKEIGE